MLHLFRFLFLCSANEPPLYMRDVATRTEVKKKCNFNRNKMLNLIIFTPQNQNIYVHTAYIYKVNLLYIHIKDIDSTNSHSQNLLDEFGKHLQLKCFNLYLKTSIRFVIHQRSVNVNLSRRRVFKQQFIMLFLQPDNEKTKFCNFYHFYFSIYFEAKCTPTTDLKYFNAIGVVRFMEICKIGLHFDSTMNFLFGNK